MAGSPEAIPSESPPPSGATRPLFTKLNTLGARLEFRTAVACVLACLHLVAFAMAGRDRLDLPFNSAPGEAPYYSDPDASSIRGYPRQPHHWSRLIVSRWDSQHYIGFAIRGLTSCPTDGSTATDLQYLECGLNWLPAWGEVGGRISDVLHAPPDITLMMMSVIAAILLNLIWTCRTIVDRIGRFEAYATLIAFNAFPSAFYVVTPYTEAATLALVMGGFVLLANQRWFLSATLIGAATALRATAVGFALGFGIAVAIVAWRRRKAGTARWWWPLVAVPLAGWGQVVQLVMLKIFVGDAGAYVRSHNAFAGPDAEGFQLLRLFDPWFYVKGFASQHIDSVMMIGTLAIILLAGREMFRRFKLEEALFLLIASMVTILMPLSTIHGYWGLNRYLLLCPFAFFCSGIIARKHFAVYALWIVLCAAIYWHVELCSYISHGDPRICSCLGRLEFWFPFRS